MSMTVPAKNNGKIFSLLICKAGRDIPKKKLVAVTAAKGF